MRVSTFWGRTVRGTLLALLGVTLGMWPATIGAYPVALADDPASLAGTYSFTSPDPFAAGADMIHLNLTLSPDGSARVERIASSLDNGFTRGGRWMMHGDEIRLVADHEQGESTEQAGRYIIRFADGFPTELRYVQDDVVEPFGPLVFTLGSGDEHPLVSRVNTMLAHVDQVDFRDPGPGVQRFGEYTRRGVAQFQSTHGLPATGMVDLRTWRALVEAVADAEQAPDGEATYTAASTSAAQVSTKPIYLTFDDGPDPTWTPRVMDLLARYGARATFFMVGQEVENNPTVVRQVVQAGDYAADHTWNHESLDGASQAEFVQSVEKTRDAIVTTASDLFTLDGTVAYVRPPYGETDESTRAYAADLGMSVVMWDVDPMDWREPGAQQIATYVLDNAYPGAIVLMHDGGGDRSRPTARLAQGPRCIRMPAVASASAGMCPLNRRRAVSQAEQHSSRYGPTPLRQPRSSTAI